MTKLTRLALLAVWLVAPGLALAVDGGDLSGATETTIASEASTHAGGDLTVRRFLLCDGDKNNGDECTVFDSHRASLGTPTRAVFSWNTATGCGTGDVITPRGSDTNDLTVMFNLGPTGSTTLTFPASNVGAQMIVEPVVNRYFTATLTDADDGCSDVEVVLQLFYSNTRR